MKQHHCKSIKHVKNENCTCPHFIVIPQPITRCNGTCFQRDFYQQKQCQYSSYVYPPMPCTAAQPWSVMPTTCNPSFNYPFHEPSYFKKIITKQKPLDPSSYRVTVRRITPPDVAATVAETYRAHRRKDSDRIHLEQFNQIIMSPHQKFSTPQTTNLYGRNYHNSDNQNIPSVPSKKCVSQNNGIQVSSTSFITTIDDQNSSISNHISEKSSEHHMISTEAHNELLSSMTEIEKSNDDTFVLSKPNSILSIINSELPINQVTSSTSEDITTNRNIDNILNKNQITKQIESKHNNIVEEHSSTKSRPTIDKTERYEERSIEEDFSPLAPSHPDIPNESNINTPDSTIDLSPTNISHPPTLPSSLPPNIDNIKSNEMLVNPSRSIKSITTSINEKQKSSTDIRGSSLPLRTARSTLDFGFLINEIITQMI